MNEANYIARGGVRSVRLQPDLQLWSQSIAPPCRCVRPTASRRCTPEISLCSCPFETAASSTRSQRLPARHAPSTLIRPTRIAGSELAAWNRVVRFQAIHVGVRAGRRPVEHTGNAPLPDAVANLESRRLVAVVGAYARPLTRRSRKADAAIPRIDSRLRVFVVRASRALLAV